jgi:hypothetical protein
MIGVPHLKHKDHSEDFQIHLFFHFSYDVLNFPFFFMQFYLFFRILYRPLKFYFISLMKVKIIKFIKCGPCYINGAIFFEIFYIAIKHLNFITLIHFTYIIT